jgi:hypothetical protein
MNETPVSQNQPHEFPESAPLPPHTGSSGRCLLYGCSAIFVGGLFLILCAGFGTYYYFTKQVKKFTSDAPQALPTVEIDEVKAIELESRLDEFGQAIAAPEAELVVSEPATVAEVTGPVVPEAAADEPAVSESAASEGAASETAARGSDPPPAKPRPRQLALSAADLNTLIARNPQLKNKLFVKIEDGVVSGDISLPLDDFLPGGKGRFFNGSGSFAVTLDNGVLSVKLVDAMVNGQPIPAAILSEFRKQNLASEFQRDAKISRTIRKFDSIQVADDRVILTLKPVIKNSELAPIEQKQ